MEPVIIQDSPLAQYLEGEGIAEQEAFITDIPWGLDSPKDTASFAPVSIGKAQNKSRRRPPRLRKLDVLASQNTVTRIHKKCSSAIHGRLGWTKNVHFLEQFRYIIVASQLLSSNSNPSALRRNKVPPASGDGATDWSQNTGFTATPSGLLSTAAIALTLAILIKWLHIKSSSTWGASTKTLLACLVLLITMAIYYYLRRQWLQYLRLRTIENANIFISIAQDFDAVTATSIGLIQDVEVVSRGYQLNNPAPPISRLEDASQIKKCARLRRKLRRSLECLFAPYFDACENLRPFAIDRDLEKYFDVYEISPADIEDARAFATADPADVDHVDSLQDLKASLQRLHIVRKIFLCSLLALNADGGKGDFTTWTVASEAMSLLSNLINEKVLSLDEIVDEEEDFPMPPTPRLPLTPGKERMRGQMRKLGNLSQGIRSLQAKMRLLREGSDRALEETDEAFELGDNLLAQYDSIGADLKDLMLEWERSRATLVTTFARDNHSRSLSCSGISHSRSPTLSLGGSTAAGGSPQGALQPIDSLKPSRSRSSTTNSSSGEEVYEAVAVPRQRSILTREERLAKVKEDRLRHAEAQGKMQANTHMLKELETVLRLRPRGRTTGRMTSV